MLSALRLPLAPIFAALVVVIGLAHTPVQAADQARLRAYLEITGFDVALESIRLSADLSLIHI